MLSDELRGRVDQFLASKGLRRTRQREVIIEAAFAGTAHFTAEELWEKARKLDPETSRATVYRTLSLLVEGELLREIDLGGTQTQYDPNFHDLPYHNHLICVDCGRVVEFEDEKLGEMTDACVRGLGFRPVMKSLRVEAWCNDLRKRGSCRYLLEARLKKTVIPFSVLKFV